MPTDASARIARNTQLHLAGEGGMTRWIDPWRGSGAVEFLTQNLMMRAEEHLAEIDAAGGMAKAIASGLPKRRIEEVATRTQAWIDAKRQKIIGVNAFAPDSSAPDSPAPHRDAEVEVLRINTDDVRAEQIARLEHLRKSRDSRAVADALKALTEAARGKANLLEVAVDAARVGASVGEMSDALEVAFSRYQAPVSGVKGVWKHENPPSASMQKMMENFIAGFGRPPRILIAKLGQDGHDRGQKVVASALSDLGFDVVVGRLFQTPDEAAAQAIEEAVDLVGMSSLAAGHRQFAPDMRAALDALGGAGVPLVIGGVIPPADRAELEADGIAAIFPPGSNIESMAAVLLDILGKRSNVA